jgi:hypothetical protein
VDEIQEIHEHFHHWELKCLYQTYLALNC